MDFVAVQVRIIFHDKNWPYHFGAILYYFQKVGVNVIILF